MLYHRGVMNFSRSFNRLYRLFVVQSKPMRSLTLLAISGLSLTNPVTAEPPSSNVSSTQNDTQEQTLAERDWQLKDTEQGYCPGHYINPNSNSNNNATQKASPTIALDDKQKVSLEQLPIKASADSTELQGDTIMFEGRVVIERGDIQLEAERVSLDKTNQQAILDKHVTIRSPEVSLSGKSATINLNDETTKINQANYLIYTKNIRGQAQSIEKTSASSEDSSDQAEIVITKGSYTVCPPDSNLWSISAKKIKLNQSSGQGRIESATLKVKDVPVLYIPYAAFPIGDQRQSGFLFPTISNSNSGLDISTPYYLNLAPNADATLTPRYNARYNEVAQTQFRWLNHFDNWKINGSYAANPSLSTSDTGLPNNEYWVLNLREQGQLGNWLSTDIQFTRTNDSQYYRDINIASLSANRDTHLTQQANANFWHNHQNKLLGHSFLKGGISLNRYQTIDRSSNEAFRQTPSLWLNYQTQANNFKPATDTTLRYDAFDHRNLSSSQRSFAQFNLLWPMRWPGISITPSIGVQHLEYQLGNDSIVTAGQDSPAVTALQGGLDAKVTLIKNQGEKQQQLIPRLVYRFREDRDQSDLPLFDTRTRSFSIQQLTHHSRYIGFDRLDNNDQVSALLTHQLLRKNGQTALSTTIGQVFYIDTPVDLIDQTELSKQSATAMEVEITPNNYWHGRSSFLWDTNNNRLDEGTIALRYQSNRRLARQSVVNLAYHYRREQPQNTLLEGNIEQGDISWVFPLAKQWDIMSRYQFDTRNNRSLETLAGAVYNNCCIRLGLVFRNSLLFKENTLDIRRDNSVFFQIQFKGLGSAGGDLHSLFAESIPGYTH